MRSVQTEIISSEEIKANCIPLLPGRLGGREPASMPTVPAASLDRGHYHNTL